jgi:xanthine/uracil permease
MRYLTAMFNVVIYVAVGAALGVGLGFAITTVVNLPLWARFIVAAGLIAAVLLNLRGERDDDGSEENGR